MSQEVKSGRILSDEYGMYGTRYVELSAQYPNSLYSWGENIEQKIAAFNSSCVALVVQGESSARIVLTEEEFGVLVASYQQYKADREQRQAEERARNVAADSFDPFLDTDDLP